MKVSISNTFKIVVLGSSGVGKSAIVRRLIENTFTPDGQPTVGVEFKPYIVPVNDQPVKLQIWDTAGQERFKSVSRAYFRNAVGAVLVYDVTNEGSFDALDDWLNDLQQLCNPNASILLVGNKTDLEVERKVGIEQARDFADKHRLEYLETSALSGANVTEAFTRLAFAVAKKVQSKQIEGGGGSGKATTVKVDPTPPQDSGKNECC